MTETRYSFLASEHCLESEAIARAPSRTFVRPEKSIEMKLLVNASNLHVGGGVTVATSLIQEFSRMPDWRHRLTLLASSEVVENLESMNTDLSHFAGFHRFDTHGLQALWQRPPVRLGDFDVVYNVFGPVYHMPMARGSIMGFAQPWIAFPHNHAYSLLSPGRRLVTRAQFAALSAFFSVASELVVEQASIRDALHARLLFRRKRVSVVRNSADSVFFQPSRWEALTAPLSGDALRLGVATRNYPHKNLSVFPRVKEALLAEHGIRADFYVTLTDNEWAATPAFFRASIRNVGPLRLAQCPTFYRSLDAIVLPTLLECFSATPLEARAVRTPLYASDLPVIRETVGDYATYFDPTDPRDIARMIAEHPPTGVTNTAPTAGADAQPYGSADRARETLAICAGSVR